MQTFKSRIFKLTIVFTLLLLTISFVSASDVNDTYVSGDQTVEVCLYDELDEFYESQNFGSGDIEDSNQYILDEIDYPDDINESYGEIDNPTLNHNDYSENDDIEITFNNSVNEKSRDDKNLDVTFNIISNSIDLNLNGKIVFFVIDYEINLFKSADFDRVMFNFIGFTNPHLYNHGILIYTLDNFSYDLKEEIIICSNEVNSNYTYSIDNSIVSVITFNFNISFFNSIFFSSPISHNRLFFVFNLEILN